MCIRDRGTTVVVMLVMVAVLVCVAIVVVMLSVATVVGTVYILEQVDQSVASSYACTLIAG